MISGRTALLVVAAIAIAWLCLPPPTSPAFEILQAPLARLEPELLDEHQPIVIPDRLADPAQLLHATFKYRYVLARTLPLAAGGIYDVQARYAVAWADGADGEVHLVHPTQRGMVPAAATEWRQVRVPYISIKLRRGQACILPHGWLASATQPMGLLEVEDVRSTLRRAARSALRA